MVMYPHDITVSFPADSTKDLKGNWVPGTDVENTFACRMESNVRNAYLNGTDGQRIDYAAICYLAIGPEIPEGSKVTVKDGGKTLLETTVKRFSAGQLNTRVWL